MGGVPGGKDYIGRLKLNRTEIEQGDDQWLSDIGSI